MHALSTYLETRYITEYLTSPLDGVLCSFSQWSLLFLDNPCRIQNFSSFKNFFKCFPKIYFCKSFPITFSKCFQSFLKISPKVIKISVTCTFLQNRIQIFFKIFSFISQKFLPHITYHLKKLFTSSKSILKLFKYFSKTLVKFPQNSQHFRHFFEFFQNFQNLPPISEEGNVSLPFCPSPQPLLLRKADFYSPRDRPERDT